jgi:hypothetical protein
MFANDRAEISLERCTHAITTMNTDETATIGIVEVNFRVPTGLINLIDPEAGCAQRNDGVAKWCAH